METIINNELIRSFGSCYNPKSIGIPDNESLPVKQWIEKYRDKVKSKNDILWLICRNDFMSDRDLRLFAVWCARESFKLQSNIDPRSINAVNIAEQFANGSSTAEDLESAESAARSAAWSAAESAAESSAESAARLAAWSAWLAAWSAQIDKLLTYFN